MKWIALGTVLGVLIVALPVGCFAMLRDLRQPSHLVNGFVLRSNSGSNYITSPGGGAGDGFDDVGIAVAPPIVHWSVVGDFIIGQRGQGATQVASTQPYQRAPYFRAPYFVIDTRSRSVRNFVTLEAAEHFAQTSSARKQAP